MDKVVALLMAGVLLGLVSGCAVVSRHTSPADGGTKTTVGLIGIDAVDNGYPLIPLYTGFDQGK